MKRILRHRTTFDFTNDEETIEMVFNISFTISPGCAMQYTAYGWSPPEADECDWEVTGIQSARAIDEKGGTASIDLEAVPAIGKALLDLFQIVIDSRSDVCDAVEDRCWEVANEYATLGPDA